MSAPAPASLEDALVRVATDAVLRRGVIAGDPEARGSLGLEASALSALLGIPEQALERFASALLSKRWQEFLAVVPLTLRACPSLGVRYRCWLGAHPARLSNGLLAPGEAEALRALPALSAELHADEAEAPWVADVLAWEAFFAASRRDREPRFLRSRWALHAVIDDLRQGLLPLDPSSCREWIRFDRDGARWRRA